MTTLFKLADQVAAFKDKLKLWEQRVKKGVLDIFQVLAETLKDSGPEQAFSDLVRSHLHVLLQEFKRYFPSAKDRRTAKKWVRNPFIFKPRESTLPVRQEDQRSTLQMMVAWMYFSYNDSANVFKEGFARTPWP